MILSAKMEDFEISTHEKSLNFARDLLTSSPSSQEKPIVDEQEEEITSDHIKAFLLGTESCHNLPFSCDSSIDEDMELRPCGIDKFSRQPPHEEDEERPNLRSFLTKQLDSCRNLNASIHRGVRELSVSIHRGGPLMSLSSHNTPLLSGDDEKPGANRRSLLPGMKKMSSSCRNFSVTGHENKKSFVTATIKPVTNKTYHNLGDHKQPSIRTLISKRKDLLAYEDYSSSSENSDDEDSFAGDDEDSFAKGVVNDNEGDDEDDEDDVDSFAGDDSDDEEEWYQDLQGDEGAGETKSKQLLEDDKDQKEKLEEDEYKKQQEVIKVLKEMETKNEQILAKKEEASSVASISTASRSLLIFALDDDDDNKGQERKEGPQDLTSFLVERMESSRRISCDTTSVSTMSLGSMTWHEDKETITKKTVRFTNDKPKIHYTLSRGDYTLAEMQNSFYSTQECNDFRDKPVVDENGQESKDDEDYCIRGNEACSRSDKGEYYFIVKRCIFAVLSAQKEFSKNKRLRKKRGKICSEELGEILAVVSELVSEESLKSARKRGENDEQIAKKLL